jgi:hypothetical protein
MALGKIWFFIPLLVGAPVVKIPEGLLTTKNIWIPLKTNHLGAPLPPFFSRFIDFFLRINLPIPLSNEILAVRSPTGRLR